MNIDASVRLERTEAQPHVHRPDRVIDERTTRESTAVVFVGPFEPDIASASYVMHRWSATDSRTRTSRSLGAGWSMLDLLSVVKRYIAHPFSVNTQRARAVSVWLRSRDHFV